MEPAGGRLPVAIDAEPRRLAAFVHADMVAYSRLIGHDDTWTYRRLARLRHALIDPALERYGGKVNNTSGDSLLMEFSSVVSAVRFAVEVQTRIPEFDDDDPPDRRMRFRMGINVGDAIPDGANMHGDSVNIAARLQSICVPGGVCVSAVVRDHVQERLGLRFEPTGPLDLKNIGRPVEAFLIRLNGQAASRPTLRARVLRPVPVVLVVVGLLASGIGAWWHSQQATPTAGPGAGDGSLPALSIAVLPFTNLSQDPDQEYLAEGIAEDLTTDLSHLEGAFVVARESAFTYRGKQVDVREVGRQLGVRYVLEGSVRKLADTVRINAQLVEADDGAHVWAERFDQALRDLQDGQDSTVQRIAAALNVKFAAAQPQPKDATQDPAAYDLVLRAKAILREPQNPSRDAIAAGYFEQALRLDPTSVPAEAGVASMLVKTTTRRLPRRATELLETAELVAPNSPDVLAARFRLERREMRYEDSVRTYRKLLDIDSSAAGIAAEFDACSRCWGRPEDAVDLLDRTARLNPLSPDRAVIYFSLGRTLLLLGRYQEAIDWLERGRRVPRLPSQPRPPGDYLIEAMNANLAAAYALAGDLNDAHSMLASALTSDKTMDWTVRGMLHDIPAYFDSARQQQERRITDGMRLAGLRDHLDEHADFRIQSTAELRANVDGPTPTSVPGATTIDTDAMMRLLESKPLVITTAVTNPTIPGAIAFYLPSSGSLNDEWQAALGKLMDEVTKGDRQRPVVTFAYSINHWQSRNLALRLVGLGYTNVYWYRGGWEAWDAHDLPKAPLDLQFAPR